MSVLVFCRYKLLRYSKERQHLDGLNNLHYSPQISLSNLYKNITVDLSPELAPIADYWTAPTDPDPTPGPHPQLTQLPSGPATPRQQRRGGGPRLGGVKRRAM